MIDTYSAFYYGYQITAQPYNGFIDIDEGSGEIQIEVPVGSYTLQTLVSAIRNALLTQGTLDYSVTVNRQTRKITISASTPFDLLTSSGSSTGSAIWDIIGFSTAADKTGQTSYTSDSASGDAYYPQFPLQSYVPDDDLRAYNQSSKNVASDGTTVEVINFGVAKFIEMDIKFITSREDVMDGVLIKKNSNGVEDARRFLRNITQLNEFEFIPDRALPDTYKRCIVERMPEFEDGTGYRLRELFNEKLRDIYETGIMRLRVIE